MTKRDECRLPPAKCRCQSAQEKFEIRGELAYFGVLRIKASESFRQAPPVAFQPNHDLSTRYFCARPHTTTAISMVALTKDRPIDHLLANFQLAHPDGAAPTTPAPVAAMAAADDASPSARGREVVRYQPSTQRETRSQLDRVAKADAGDLQARLELIPLEATEEVLAQQFHRHHPDRSILSYLRNPGDGVAPYKAASAVLEELADQTEEMALESALVFRYIQAHALWRGHPDSGIRSAEDLVQHLDGSDYI